MCVGVTDEVGIIDRQSSIDSEPRTLNVTQIDFAREAALYVVNTKSIDEALNIFTQGVEPVVMRCEGECLSDNGSKWNIDDNERSNAIAAATRDIASAPF